MGTSVPLDNDGQADNRQASLADALFSGTRQTLLRLFFLEPERTYTLTELIDLAKAGRGAVQRETARLTDAGLIVQSGPVRGRQYQANKQSPVFDELCSIARKLLGPGQLLRTALAPLSDRIALALLYGSVAQGVDHAASDVDVLIVSDALLLEDVLDALTDAEKALGRQINPTLYTRAEFDQRRADQSPFLTEVLQNPHEILFGFLE